MLFSKSLLLLSAVGLSVAKVDVGGPHGNFAPAKRHVNSDAVPPRFEARSNGFERRVKKRGTGKCNTSQGSSSTPTASADSGYASPEAGYMGDSGSASASASAAPSSAAPSNPVADNEAGYAAAAQQSGSSESSDSSSGNIVSDVLDGITGFLGDNTGIGSWFRTNNGNDDTNGRSWCQLNYEDDWLGFAPSVGTMLGNFGDDLPTAAKHYCGLEAKATNPNNGKSANIYIVDGFDDSWVQTPGSIDLTIGAWNALAEPTDSKEDVIQNLQWSFTGNQKEEYTYNYGN